MRFEITGGSTGTEKLELVEQPILNWSNPERRTPAGALFLWTLDGRPQVAMGIYPVADMTLDHEFQSLSPYPLKTVPPKHRKLARGRVYESHTVRRDDA